MVDNECVCAVFFVTWERPKHSLRNGETKPFLSLALFYGQQAVRGDILCSAYAKRTQSGAVLQSLWKNRGTTPSTLCIRGDG